MTSRRVSGMPAWVVAAALAVAYLIINPPSADLAAQVYRSDLFAREGFTLWDGAWYGGHHMPGYSVLFPPLAALVGPRVVGAISAVAAAALFERIVAEHFGERARVGALWFAAATAINLITGRLAFGLGVTVALGAVLAATHRHAAWATVLAALSTLASPVAGVFLALACVAWFAAHRQRAALAVGAGALIPALVLIVAFPEGGVEPFVASSFWPALATLAAIFVALPREERALRIGVGLYGLATVASFVLDTPMGGNVTRLGAVFAGPLLACLLWRRRGAALAVLAIPLVYWQWNAPVRDWVRASDDPSVHASYYKGLLGFLDSHDGQPFRVEIPFTANHWEAARVAPRFPLARGWERQLDIRDNKLFYGGDLSPARYRAWLGRNGVRYVALPDVRLDGSAKAEAALIRDGLPYLRPAWRDSHWSVYEVRGARGLADGGARVTSLGTEHVALQAERAGAITVRVRFTPYWKLVEGAGCVSRSPGGWTRLQLDRAGPARIAARFAPGRVVAHGPRCTRT